jgi:hypothetical protein
MRAYIGTLPRNSSSYGDIIYIYIYIYIYRERERERGLGDVDVLGEKEGNIARHPAWHTLC